jgi:hypothetical protein
MIEEMIQQDLPNLVDERRFRRREPENFERDEFGRVCLANTYLIVSTNLDSENGPRRRSPLVLNLLAASICEHRSSAVVVITSSIFNRRPAAKFRSRVEAQASWSHRAAKRARSPCISTLLDLVPKVLPAQRNSVMNFSRR